MMVGSDTVFNWDSSSITQRYGLLRWMIDEHSYRKVKSLGHIQVFDVFTASAVKKVADALSDENRRKFLGSSLPKVVNITWALLK